MKSGKNIENEALYSERQGFNQWWIWIIILGLNALFLYGIYQQIIEGISFGSKPMSNAALIILTIVVILLTIGFYSVRLETYIKQDGIYLRFFPFHRNFKFYDWNTITKITIREYKPLKEYGGWGLRVGILANGQAFNVSGNIGLQLELMNNDKLLIGTRKSQELNNVLRQLGRLEQRP